MCGIAGYLLNKPVTENPLEILKRMGGSIAYRGPDDSGYFFDSVVGIGLVHRRLSILDLSDRRTPAHVVSFRALRDHLQRRSFQFPRDQD